MIAEVSRTLQLALTTHPDKNPDNEGATQQFQQISEAYHVLATYLDKSAHRHEYADPFDPYDDDEDYDDDGGGFFVFDLEELEFYLWVVPPLFREWFAHSRLGLCTSRCWVEVAGVLG